MTTPALDRGRAVTDRVVAYLDSEGRHAAAKSLRAQRDARRDGPPTIVIAGEDKRGKSSLLNALLAQPDLSPVGAKVVTGTPLRFVHSEAPTAEVFRYGSSTSETMAVEKARALATVDGNPANEQGIEMIEIGLPIALLEVMTVIDTPGVGGLVSGHAELTLQSLHSADALLFVVDAAAPMRAQELNFLRRASARIQAVILVVTKTDIHPGWRQILDDDVRILTEQAPRFAGSATAGVSSASALRALSLDDPDFAAEIRVESGLAGLEQLLRSRVAAEVEIVRTQNVLRAGISRLALVERDLAEQRAASEPSGAGVEALDKQAAALAALREERAAWPGRLNADIRKLTVNREDICARSIMEIRHRYEQQAQEAKPDEFAGLPGEVLAELTALAGELNEYAATRLAEITSQLLDDLDDQVSVQQGIAQISGGELSGMATSFAPTSRRVGHAQRMEMLSELGRGRSLLSLASGSSALAFLAPPFGIVLGVGLGALFAFTSWREHGRQGRNADFRVWLSEQVGSAQLTIRNEFAAQVADLQNEIAMTVRRVLGEREDALKRSIDQANALRRSESATRVAQQRQLDERGATARKLRLEALASLRELGTGDG